MCFNLADVVCAVGVYKLTVLSSGEAVVEMW